MSRLPFLDWVRGFAVVAMVMWHTADAWLRPELRDGQGWLFIRFVGGLAAPSFLFLAGISAALAVRANPTPEQRERAFWANLARGLEIVVLAYALRLQTWLIDASALWSPAQARAFLPIGASYGLFFYATRCLERSRARALLCAAIALPLALAGFAQVEDVAPGRFARLLQVDVLHAIGTSLCLLALGQRAFGLLELKGLCCALGLVVACFTQTVWNVLPGILPTGLAGYVGKYTPLPGSPQPSLFPLFPWLAYPLFGASIGAFLRGGGSKREERALVLAFCGAALAAATSEAHPYVRAWFEATPWLTHPLRIAFRIGIVSYLFVIGDLWARGQRGRIFLDFGRTSLRIYWAHMLFAYGVLGRSLQKTSSYGTWLVGLCALLALMWGFAQIGQRVRSPAKASAVHS